MISLGDVHWDFNLGCKTDSNPDPETFNCRVYENDHTPVVSLPEVSLSPLPPSRYLPLPRRPHRSPLPFSSSVLVPYHGGRAEVCV